MSTGSTSRRPEKPVRVALVDDYPLVTAGLMTLLAPHRHRVQVLPQSGRALPPEDVDIVLFDTFGPAHDGRLTLGGLTGKVASRVAVYTWRLQPDLVDEALALGAQGYLFKGMAAEGLVDAFEKIRHGRTVVAARPAERAPGDSHTDWRRVWGLTDREADILKLIASGVSNQDIARELYLSLNSVKSYIRTAYRKIGVRQRREAVIWGRERGLGAIVAPHEQLQMGA